MLLYLLLGLTRWNCPERNLWHMLSWSTFLHDVNEFIVCWAQGFAFVSCLTFCAFMDDNYG